MLSLIGDVYMKSDDYGWLQGLPRLFPPAVGAVVPRVRDPRGSFLLAGRLGLGLGYNVVVSSSPVLQSPVGLGRPTLLLHPEEWFISAMGGLP